jgi:hypothetical protein
MKKVLAILSIVVLASCGGSSSTDSNVDSTAVDSVLLDTVLVYDTLLKVDSVE